MDDGLTITPNSYHLYEHHRVLADAVISRSGLDKKDVAEMTLENGEWRILVFRRNYRGKHYVGYRGTGVASRTVRLPA